MTDAAEEEQEFEAFNEDFGDQLEAGLQATQETLTDDQFEQVLEEGADAEGEEEEFDDDDDEAEETLAEKLVKQKDKINELKRFGAEKIAELCELDEQAKQINNARALIRQELVTKGLNKKAAAAVKAYLSLNENDRDAFDDTYRLLREGAEAPIKIQPELFEN